MKTNTDFKADDKLGLLLVGDPWSGKSTVMMHFPDLWVCDADRNLGRISKNFPNKTFYYDYIDVDDNGAPVQQASQWLRLLAITQKAYEDPRVRYLCFDSMTAIGHILERYVISQGSSSKDLIIGGEKSMTLQLWNPYKDLWLKFITTVRSGTKPCIFICHQKVDKDELSGTLFLKPMIGGQLADSIGRLYTDVWHCVAVPGMPTKENPSGVEYTVETVPQPRMAQLGSSLGLPPKFRFDWKIIAEKLGEKV